jgi:hypothetical protein
MIPNEYELAIKKLAESLSEEVDDGIIKILDSEFKVGRLITRMLNSKKEHLEFSKELDIAKNAEKKLELLTSLTIEEKKVLNYLWKKYK